MNFSSFTIVPKNILNFTKNLTWLKELKASLRYNYFYDKQKLLFPLLFENSTPLNCNKNQKTGGSLTIDGKEFGIEPASGRSNLPSADGAKRHSLDLQRKKCGNCGKCKSLNTQEHSRLTNDKKANLISCKNIPNQGLRFYSTMYRFNTKMCLGEIRSKTVNEFSTHPKHIHTTCSTASRSVHTSTRNAFRQSDHRQSSRRLDSSQEIRDSVSMLVGNPDWNQLVRSAVLNASGEDSEGFVDGVIFPYISQYVRDTTLVDENLIVLLLTKIAGSPPGSTDNKSNSKSVPRDGHLSIATSMMMLRILLRLHCKTEIDSKADGEGNTTLEKLNTLIGCILVTATSSEMSSLNRPLVFSLFYRAFSNAVSEAFIDANSLHESSDKSTPETKEPTEALSDMDQQLYPWENATDTLGRLCECAVLLSGLEPRLQAAAKKFGNDISLARKAVSEINENIQGLTDAKYYLLSAMNHLKVFPENQDKELMEKLVINYIGGVQG